MSSSLPRPEGRGGSAFPETRWTLVRKIQQGSPDDARGALDEVCQTYWFPVYGFLRRSGHSPHDAEDYTQLFFQQLIEDRTLQSASAERGRLRAFLLGALKRVLGNHFQKAKAEKRGGAVKIVSFEEQMAENWYALEPADLNSPDAVFDHAWAIRVLEAAEGRLRAECQQADDLQTFEALREFLPLGENATPYKKVAAGLCLPEPTVRLQIHRMRKRYRMHIEEEVGETVSDKADLKAELEHLMKSVGQ